MREDILFDSGWTFHRGDIDKGFPETKNLLYFSAKTQRENWSPASPYYYTEADPYNDKVLQNTERWEKVEPPHDYLVGDTPNEHNNNTRGFVQYDNAWYRKKFIIPAEDLGKRLTLLFEGVAIHATVWLNGCLLKRNFCSYTSFEVDITDVAKYGEKNVLAVYINNEEHEGWWYEGAGIYRHVRLIKTSPVAIDLWGVYVVPKKLEHGWSINVESTVRNDTEDVKSVTVVNEILDRDGTIVASVSTSGEVSEYAKNTLKATTSLENPKLWDLDSPYLYTCRTKVFVQDEETDCYDTRFGFRTVEFTPNDGLFLNGKKIFLNGVCGHQSFGLTGSAVPDNIRREQVHTLKEMGANAYRTSHYPQSEAVMDAFDELGMLVMDETRWFESSDEGLRQLEMLIKRDRNRPSVIIWSLGNEEELFMEDEAQRILKRMKSFAKKLDDSRPFTVANDKYYGKKITVYDDSDVIGINYNYNHYATTHEKYPDKPIVASECIAVGTSRGWYYPNDAKHAYVTAYDDDATYSASNREKAWKTIRSYPWVIGAFQWHAYEYRGESVNWPRLCSISGVIDLFWQKKDAFYQNVSFFTQKPMVHLLPHWNFEGREGEPIRVVAYTNCEEVELYLDGCSLGICKVEQFGHAEWNVPFKAGKLQAVARNNGEDVAVSIRETTKKGVRLSLKLMNVEPLHANGKDLALVSCSVLDEDGREVPTATPYLRFTTNKNGYIYSTGSDNTDHNSIYIPDRKMYAGKATAAVKVGKEAGPLRVYVEADGLISASLEINLL